MAAPYIPADDGRWVNSDYERLARLIKEYDAGLELRWIPPDRRTRDDKAPYVIVDTRVNEVVLHATELDTPVDILSRLYLADGDKGNVLQRLEAREIAAKLMENQAWIDAVEEASDEARFLFTSPLHTVRFKGKKLDHYRRPVL